MIETTSSQKKIFFPNLDGLRFFCFLLVFLFHCNETIFNRISDHTTRGVINFLFQNGNTGVNIFFVLSGFLITFLLIEEKKLKKTIDLKNFYTRRVLRIWPLFYLCVFFGFVFFPFIKYNTIPAPNEVSNCWYYIFFAANFNLIQIWPKVPGALSLIVLWSVAVEEQFYLAWPVILKYSNAKKYPYIFFAVIFFTLLFRSFYTENTPADYAIRFFHTFSVIGDMAVGGMAAYYCSYDNIIFNCIKKMPRWQIVLLYIFTVCAILFRKIIFFYFFPMLAERIVLSVLFALIIAEQNFADNSLFKFSKFKIISNLGIYTYGLYCLHFIGILATQMLIDKFHLRINSLFTSSLACIAALIITTLVSMLSYHLYEKHFLRLKDKFAFIVKK